MRAGGMCLGKGSEATGLGLTSEGCMLSSRVSGAQSLFIFGSLLTNTPLDLLPPRKPYLYLLSLPQYWHRMYPAHLISWGVMGAED